MKTYYYVFLICGFALVSSGAFSQARFCDDEIAALVSRAYVLSIPVLGNDNMLEQLINANPSAFLENGAATRCMRSLGSALIQQAIQFHLRNNPYAGRALFGGRMPPGLGNLPTQVDANIQRAATDLATVGQELMWLSQVLPAALHGNSGPYRAQGTLMRQQMLSQLPLWNLQCSLYASLCQLMLNSIQSTTIPMLEQNVYGLATGHNQP